MNEFKLRFLASQAADGTVFSAEKDQSNPITPGTLAGFSHASYRPTDSDSLADLEEDGGYWAGSVHILPSDVFNMTATYFPKRNAVDNIQLSGPIMMRQGTSSIAIVGGGGRYAGARGEAICVVSMSDQNTPLYHYELRVRLQGQEAR